MRRPPYFLWEGRDGEIKRKDELVAVMKYLLWVDRKGNAVSAVTEQIGRRVLPSENNGSTRGDRGNAHLRNRSTSGGSSLSGAERLQEPALLDSRVDSASAK